MSKFIVEMLDEINKEPLMISNYKDTMALKILFEYAFDPNKKFLLPEGEPPYKEDPAPLGMSPSNFSMEMRRLYVFRREDLNKIRREKLFIELLEGVHPSEAKLLLAVKEQNLTSLYPNVTHELLYDAGVLSFPPVAKETEVPKSSDPVKKSRNRTKKTGT